MPITRRSFIGRAAGSGLAFTLPAGLAACGGSDDDPAPTSPPGQTQPRSLFFNLSHEEHRGKTYWLTGGGQRHALVPCAEKPEVLSKVRQTHGFLRSVPDSQITHLVEGVSLPADSVTLCYISADLDSQAGTWAMSSVQLLIPTPAVTQAYASARVGTPSGPLPLSAKRRAYGLAAAQTEQDLGEEQDLLDVNGHAATLVGCHPDLMSLDPGAAHIVRSNHLDTSIEVFLLANKLQSAGPALPEQVPDQPNPTGWATMVPVRDIDGIHGEPLVNVDGLHKGRIQYQPDTHPSVRPLAQSAILNAISLVKNDTALGADITGLDAAPDDQPNAALSGAIWMRHDGTTRIDQSASTGFQATVTPTMTLKKADLPGGFKILPTVSQSSSGAQTVTLKFICWFLQFRGVYLQFLDANGAVLKLTDIPEYNNATIVKTHTCALSNPQTCGQDTDDAMLLAFVGPAYTVLGIPVAPGFSNPSFTVPAMASTVRILSSGLSFQGGNVYPETVLTGAILTGVINYGLTTILAVAGGANFLGPLLKSVVIPEIFAIAQELVVLTTSALGNNLAESMKTPKFWGKMGIVAGKALLSQGVSAGLKALVENITEDITTTAAADAVPVAGQALQAISVAVGAVNVIETTAELASTPWSYVDDLVFTHDLSLTLTPDPNDNTFPKAADSYTVTALFDDGSPYVQTLPLATVASALPPVTFKGVPLGGKVNLSVAFVQTAIQAGADDILLGRGSTGAVDNTVANARLTLQIEEVRFPIGANTRYQHAQKTALDAAGNHLWSTGPAPVLTAATSVCGGAGTICGLRGITVRQGTQGSPGYVGYAWQAQNNDPNVAPSCLGGGVGQLDQVANLNTGPNAQDGYLNSGCGIAIGGVQIAYSILAQGGANFYLDTTLADAPMLRSVNLGANPSIDPPLSGLPVWGVLNFASDTLLMHPAGHLVSISNVNHKIETHRLPATPLDETDARVALLAQPKSGKGSRPGLIDTPVTAAVTADGVILVLEAGNNRIQAFDLGANPVQHFTAQTTPYYFPLTATDSASWRYLDVAVEYTGFIYVLSYHTGTFIYQLDIYHPKQSGTKPIATTMDVNAAHLTVDFWRNVYTLNYEVLQLPGGLAAPTTEPTVSLWTPCASGVTC